MPKFGDGNETNRIPLLVLRSGVSSEFVADAQETFEKALSKQETGAVH
jgi:hypothetical protein